MRWGTGLIALSLSLYFSCQRSSSSLFQAAYVGDTACFRCHVPIAKAYAHTWKARSLLPVTPDLPRIEDFQQPAVYDPHANFYYRARWEGDTLYLYEYRLRGRDTVYLRKERLDYVIGSGHQTRSYLLWRNGFLYEAPLTWYVRANKWDLSPGYHGGQNTRFSREIRPACLACHASGTVSVPWTYNKYEVVGGALGCESCHGPGSLHVEQPYDSSYYWRTWPTPRQMDVCSRCHLEGIAVEKKPGWKPGDTLGAFYAIFLPVRPELGSFGIASHAERLMRSACFQRGKVTCTTCHAPHPVERVPSYEQRCTGCHTGGCRNPAHPKEGCIGCHMPKGPTSDIPHTQFTDHYIRVVRREASSSVEKSGSRLVCATENEPDSGLVGEAYLRWYNEGERRPEVLAQALQILERWGPPKAQAEAYLLAGRYLVALNAAEGALRSDTMLASMELYGYLLEISGNIQKALSVWEWLAKRAPAHPEASFRATVLAYQLGRLPASEAYERLRELTCIQPWNVQFQYNAAVVAGQLGQRDRVLFHLRAALSADPDYPPARQAWERLAQ